MALGYFLRTSVSLAHTAPAEAIHRRRTEELLGLVLAQSNLLGESRHPNWGLPFPWPTLADQRREGDEAMVLAGDFFWDANNPHFTGPLPAHHGYAVTTAIVGQGVIDAYELTGRADLEATIAGIGHWFLQDCGVRKVGGDRMFFNYSPHMRHKIYNGSALAAAFMARAGRLLDQPSWITTARAAMRLLEDLQDDEGGWVYAEERPEIEYHYGYYLESLAIYHRATGDDFAARILRRGADFYQRCFFEADGKSYDNLTRAGETRLWAYGWAMFAFVYSWEITGEARFREQAGTVYRYLLRRHWNPAVGAFRFKPGEPAYYMRDEAHVAYGLAKLLESETPQPDR